MDAHKVRPYDFSVMIIRKLLLSAVVAISSGAAFSNTAVEPVPRPNNPDWLKRHEGFAAIAARGEPCKVLFIGDSITDAWRSKGLETWNANYAALPAVNIGISGDRTQHLLWRLQNMDLKKLNPRVVVMMIGTNNTGFESDKVRPRNATPEIAAGVEAIVGHLRATLPDAKILLLAVFPRGEKDSPARAQVTELNTLIAPLHDGRHIHFLDIGRHFLKDDGVLPAEIMPDLLHPNAAGYKIWADAMRSTLARLLE